MAYALPQSVSLDKEKEDRSLLGQVGEILLTQFKVAAKARVDSAVPNVRSWSLLSCDSCRQLEHHLRACCMRVQDLRTVDKHLINALQLEHWTYASVSFVACRPHPVICGL